MVAAGGEGKITMVNQVCPRCNKTYTLGVNGAYNDKRKQDECDNCSGVTRDSNGHAWAKDERFHLYQNDDGTTERVERHQAMGQYK